MSQQCRPLLTLPVVATGVITQYRGVAFNDAQATAIGQKIKGFARRGAAIGAETEVIAKGTAVAEAGAAITVGAALVIDATGRVITAAALAVSGASLQVASGGVAVTSSATSGAILTGNGTITGGDLPHFVCGYALEAATAAGAFIEIILS